jgi:hypothetical protein
MVRPIIDNPTAPPGGWPNYLTRICVECKHCRPLGTTNAQEPRNHICAHPACCNHITGIPILCMSARNTGHLCGRDGRLFEALHPVGDAA